MKKTYLLEKLMSGVNLVCETTKEIEKSPGVRKFSEVLGELELKITEVQKVLCLKKEDADNLRGNGYISGDAINNLLMYIEAKNAVTEFQDSQYGEGDPESLKRLKQEGEECNKYFSEGTFGHP